MFGEKSHRAKVNKAYEKHGLHEMDMQEIMEELARVRAQVAEEQKQKASVLSELNVLKKAVEGNQVHSSESSSCKDAQDEVAFAELEDIKVQKSKLEQELFVALQEKDRSQRQAEEALLAAEVNAKRAEELSKEMLGTKESLLLVKMACVETNKEREALWVARKAQTKGQTHIMSPGSPNKSNKLEHKLNVAKSDFSKEDSRVIRQSLVSARDALANIDRLKAGCGSPVTDATITLELEAAKSEVSKALESDALVESTLKELQDKLMEANQELDATTRKLAEVTSREASVSAEMAELKLEFEKVKSELRAAVSCNEAFVGFSQRLQRESTQEGLTCKADDAAKAELHALLKEEAEAVRQITPKASRDACLSGKRDKLETVYEDSNMVLSQIEASNASHVSHRQSTVHALSSGMQAPCKEEHVKKFSLLSFGKLLSKSKRRALKGTSSTRDNT
ncbi:hypothetical protein GOP47_0007484 [Adiantum capillus-veneris]|uniref:WEB family protein n=1 Tax=Adiantum capillus-veneris TaxID=13818 RepID=A0A9D4V1D3_ADICA|nr:hypothetical protein GOP47_0007484 [Adiantum capillus-veneris]